MHLKEISLHNFRCFSTYKLQLDSKIILIEGNNGTGKTSLLEALYYGCYLRSFRTRLTSDIIKEGIPEFSIKIKLQDADLLENEVQIGFVDNKKLLKLNQKNIQSYKELIDTYKVIALTEDDINLIKGSPDKRRAFLDQYVLLHKPHLVEVYKKFKRALDNRNALFYRGNPHQDTYDIWTKQIWHYSKEIRQERIEVATTLNANVAALYKTTFGTDSPITAVYAPKDDTMQCMDYEEFKNKHVRLIDQEMSTRKNLIGCHLDDLVIQWSSSLAKNFASRGQQKMTVVLFKIAQIIDFATTYPHGLKLFLLDDFVTDFDNEKIAFLINLLNTIDCQIIFTCPTEDSFLKSMILKNNNTKFIKLY